jgi:UPF0042 nucleotide-binding protein
MVPIDDFVVITGLSGAGKSQAMACFEDAGYFCVDNLPPEMMSSLAELIEHDGSKVDRTAVVCDVRAGEHFEELSRVLDELERRGAPCRLLYLEASDEVLVNRYKETRRRHPVAPHGRVQEGVAVERARLEPLRERADVRIDTTETSAALLRRLVAEKMLPSKTPGRLAITFITYGHKHGAPRDTDLAFDVRFLPNPYWEPELRWLTGLDQAVIDYVVASDGLGDFYDRLVPLLDYLLPAYVREGKSHLTIGIGCTGGRHRSVVVAEHLAALYRTRPDYTIGVVHRDIDKAPRRP